MSIALRVEDDGLSRLVERVRRFGLNNTRSLMDTLAFEGESQTRRRIADEKTAPDGSLWPAWSPAYANTRHGGQGLLEGQGDLVDSVTSDAGTDFAEWGSNLVYFAIHNFGGTPDMAPGPAAIPQRQMLGLSPENEADMMRQADDWADRQMRQL